MGFGRCLAQQQPARRAATPTSAPSRSSRGNTSRRRRRRRPPESLRRRGRCRRVLKGDVDGWQGWKKRQKASALEVVRLEKKKPSALEVVYEWASGDQHFLGSCVRGHVTFLNLKELLQGRRSPSGQRRRLHAESPLGSEPIQSSASFRGPFLAHAFTDRFGSQLSAWTSNFDVSLANELRK